MGNFLSQLSAISRSMANDLQSLSDQYQQAVMQPAENNNLQRISLRAARAMHRLASVQNTVFPMLANASFVGTSPGPVSYRYQPTRLTAAQPEILSTPNPATMGGARTHGHHRAPLLRGLPLPPLPRGPGVIGLIPSIVAAHARASAQSVNAAFAAASANAGSRSGPGQPSSSSTTPSPATSTPSTAPTPSSTLPFNIPAPSSTGPNVGSGHPGPYTTRNTARSNNGLPPYAITNPFAVHHDQSAAARIFIPDFTAGIVDIWRSFPGSMSSSESGGSSSTSPTSTEATSMGATDSAATRAVQGAFEQLDQALTPLLSSRRRVRPEDFSTGPDDRSVLRRRLGVHPTSSTADLRRLRQELDQLMSAGLPGSTVAPSAPALTPRPAPPVSITSSSTQTSSRSGIGRSSSGDSRRPQTSGSSADAPPPAPPAASSTSPGSPSTSSSSSNNSSNNNASPAYNLGRIGVFISAILRMVDQPREDGSPRTLADVICNDPESPSTPLQELVRNLAEAVTVRETRLIVEGFPAPLRNLHPVLNTFIREQALNGQQLTETNLDYVADLFSRAIMDAVHAGDILETLTPPASIQISAEDIRNISLGVLREHFRRLIYLVVAAPTGRENNWPTFARDMILWIRDVVGAWRVAFYGLFQERDQPEAQRIATHVVGSAIHANGRRWVELSNRATNTMVNVLCANIVPRRRGEEQAGGLVGGAWPLMATSRPNAPRSRICHAPSLLGSTAPPAPLGPLTPSTMARAFGSASFTESSGSRNAAAAAVSSLETQMLSENLARRISELITPSGSSSSSSSSDNATTESLATTTLSIQEAILAELEALRSASTSSSTIPITSTTATTSAAATASSPTLTGNSTSTDESESASTSGRHSKSRRTRVEEVEDEEKP
ncbi:hypothetical protein B0O80DRAFT_126936 [Mortierella sp. GBAus27b]|nr:hypothetical protein B0O80DRAFT_126936 [Mortierella sp. GBAus27b]